MAPLYALPFLVLLMGGYVGYLTEELLLYLGVRLGPSAMPLPQLRSQPPPQPRHLHHFSVATRASPWGLHSPVAMSAALGTQQQLVGLGDARAPSPASGFKWAYALKLLHIEAAVRALPKGDLVLVTDAFDAYPVVPLDRVESAFAAAAARGAAADGRAVDILVSAEAWCFPNQSLAGDFPAANRAQALPYPNSGVYVGRAGALLRLLRDGPPWDLASTDDQDWFARAYLASLANASLPRVALDHASMVAFNVGPLRSLRSDLAWDVRAQAWQDRSTGSHPSIFHFNGDKDDVQRALVPKFFYGQACLTEHWASCTWWAVVAPAAALLAAGGALLLPWQHLLQPPGEALLGLLQAAQGHLPQALRRPLPLLQHLPPLLLLTPPITVLVLAAACPLCARPQATLWETLEVTLWPPSQLLLGHTEDAGGRALAVAGAVVLEEALVRWLGRHGAGGGGCTQWALRAGAGAGAAALGGLLLQLAGGPGTELPGCLLVAPIIMALCRLGAWRLGSEAMPVAGVGTEALSKAP